MEYLLNIIEIPEIGLRRAGDFCLAGLRHLKDHFIPHARNNYHPHILGHRVLALFSVALLAMKFFVIALVAWGPVLPAFSSAITSQNIISLTNQSRADYKLGVLAESSVLDKAAQAKADDMLAKGYFSHTTPDGKTPWSFITAAGYNYLMAGENLAVNFQEAENVETAWMNSPGHKANILNKNFEEIGIGISQGTYQGHEAIFVVQMFGVPAEQKVTLTNEPTKVQTAVVPAPAALPTPPPVKITSQIVKGTQAGVPSATLEPLAITSADTQMQGDQISISAQIAGSPVKAIAYFGEKAVMLLPKADGAWAGVVSLQELAAGNVTVKVKALDIKNATTEIQLADFSNGTVQNYNVVSQNSGKTALVNWWGRVFDPKSAEERFYMLFIAGILSSMVLAIGIKRHIQHLSLVANSSFVVMLACLLWMAG